MNAILKALSRKRVYKTKINPVENSILISARIQLYTGKLERTIPAKEFINMANIPPNRKIFFIQLSFFIYLRLSRSSFFFSVNSSSVKIPASLSSPNCFRSSIVFPLDDTEVLAVPVVFLAIISPIC